MVLQARIRACFGAFACTALPAWTPRAQAGRPVSGVWQLFLAEDSWGDICSVSVDCLGLCSVKPRLPTGGVTRGGRSRQVMKTAERKGTSSEAKNELVDFAKRGLLVRGFRGLPGHERRGMVFLVAEGFLSYV